MSQTSPPPFIVVGIGASAGGLHALQQFFEAMPAANDMAFVIVTHLAPEQESHLATLLQPYTTMPVCQVTETLQLERNQVYVIPPNRNLTTIDSHLRLLPLEAARRNRAPIDHFLRTLAGTHGAYAIGIILSGTGSDGTIGLQRIKEAGGLTVVQEPSEAAYDGMPQSAIATGLVDLILPLHAMPARLLAYAQSVPLSLLAVADVVVAVDEPSLLRQILTQIRLQTGQDFARYKRSTILRRIQRRMQIHQLADLPSYVRFLRGNQTEVSALYQNLLITVTNFFRDPEAFAQLAQEVIPHLFTAKGPADPVRVWVAGCATGEEAYSIAILLLEQAQRLEQPVPIQVFATDLSESALRQARTGLYAEPIEADVSPERLARFFSREQGRYRVKPFVRETVLFAPHNLIKDPPFSKLDLISCRNLLIYLDREIHTQVFDLFHYALRPDGYLLLSPAESMERTDLFHAINKKYSLFHRSTVWGPAPRFPVLSFSPPGLPPTTAIPVPDGKPAVSYGLLHQRMVERYAPPSVLVNADYTLVHVSEHAGRYLQQPGGEPTNNLLKRIHPALRLELTSALYGAVEKQQSLRVLPLPMQVAGAVRRVGLHVLPARESELQGYILVIFDESEAPGGEMLASPDEAQAVAHTNVLNLALVEELDRIKKRLSTTIEEVETTREEMRAGNEELLSINEELKSTTEELETGKEELQSLNEELFASNAELKYKIEELGDANSDLQNLLTATDIAILFLDRELRIKQFTQQITEFFNILTTDQERPLAHITHKLAYADLLEDAATVLRTQVPNQREVSSEGGRWCLLRLLPYHTTNAQIDGIVITLVDITERKQVEQQMAYHAHLLANMHDAVFATDPHLKVTAWNKGAEKMYGWQPDEVINHPVQEVVRMADDGESWPRIWRQLATTGRYEGEIITYHRDGAAIATEGLTIALQGEDGQLSGYLTINRDISKRKQAEVEKSDLFKEVAQQGDLLRNLNAKLAAAQESERKELARELHDRVGQNLTALGVNLKLIQSQLALRLPTNDPLEMSIQDMRAVVKQMTKLIRDVMAELRPPMLDDYGLLTTLKWYATQLTQRTGLVIVTRGEEPEPRLAEHIALGLFRITQEALNNVVKHAQATQITITLTSALPCVLLSIADNGRGLDPLEIDSTQSQGWGMLTMGERAAAIGGRFWLESQPGQGVVVWIEVTQ